MPLFCNLGKATILGALSLPPPSGCLRGGRTHHADPGGDTGRQHRTATPEGAMPTAPSSRPTLIETVRTGEAARMLGVPIGFVRMLIELRWLEAYKPPRSQWRITRESIARLRRGLPPANRAAAVTRP
jgi:excisionase family DNA binding protein